MQIAEDLKLTKTQKDTGYQVVSSLQVAEPSAIWQLRSVQTVSLPYFIVKDAAVLLELAAGNFRFWSWDDSIVVKGCHLALHSLRYHSVAVTGKLCQQQCHLVRMMAVFVTLEHLSFLHNAGMLCICNCCGHCGH